MKANELRIGNYVNNCGQYCYVMSIYKTNKVELGYFKDSIGFVRSLDDIGIKPIPIKEYWLCKFGFKKSLHSGYYDKKWLSGDFFFDGKKLLVITEGLIDGDFPDIIYVHQLQNLYFTLTGNELECQPSIF